MSRRIVATAIVAATCGLSVQGRREQFDIDHAGYSVIQGQFTQVEAQYLCQGLGGYLAPVYSRDGNDYLQSLATEADTRSYWLGGKRKDPTSDNNDDASFEWEGVPDYYPDFGVTLPNVDAYNGDRNHDLWAKKEPNNFRQREDCVQASSADGRWNDARCDANAIRASAACWVKPTTTTTTDVTSTTTDVTSTTTDVTSTTTDVTSTTTDVTSTTTDVTSTTTDVTSTTTDVTSTTTDVTSTTTDVTSTTTDVTSTTTVVTSTTEVPTTTEEPTTTTKLEPGRDWVYFPESDCWYQQFGSNNMKKNFNDAADHCSGIQFHDSNAWLVTPTTIAEAEFVGSLGSPGKPAWIGAQYNEQAGAFLYTGEFHNNEPILEGNWNQDEPNGDPRDTTLCVQRGLSQRRKDVFPGKFTDADCSNTIYWTCQYCHSTTTTPQPTTTTTTDVTTTTTDVTTTTTDVTTTTTDVTTTTTHVTTTTTVVTTTTMAPTTLDIPEDWTHWPDNDCYYYQSATKMDWHAANDTCYGMHEDTNVGEISFLAAPMSEDEAMFMASFQLRAGNPSWVGVYRDDNQQWRKLPSNSIYNVDLWYPGEGNDRNENCAQMGYNSRRHDTHPYLHNDASCSGRNYAICKWCPPPKPTTTTTDATSTTTDATSTTTDATSTTTDASTTTTVVTSTTTTGDVDIITQNLVDGTSSPVTPGPTPGPTINPSPSPSKAPSSSAPTPSPTVSPATSQPTPLPTSAPSSSPATSNPTPAPTTSSPTSMPTCGAADATVSQEALEAISDHHSYIGQVLADTMIRKSGRAEPYKTTCDDYCAQRSFGAGCQPCHVQSLTTEAECMFPGPFGTGVLCFKDPVTQNVTTTKCCMRKNEKLEYAPGNEMTTCRLPKRQCNCDSGFDYTKAFTASRYMAPLNRVWTGTQCISV